MSGRKRKQSRQKRAARVARLYQQHLSGPPTSSPPSASQDNSSTGRAAFVTMHYVGPLPHPSILKGFDEVVPGLADRLVARFEAESEHRQALEKRQLEILDRVVVMDDRLAGRGMTWGAIIAILWLLVSALIVYTGHPITGGVFGSASIAGLVGAFLKASHDRKAAREDQRKGE